MLSHAKIRQACRRTKQTAKFISIMRDYTIISLSKSIKHTQKPLKKHLCTLIKKKTCNIFVYSKNTPYLCTRKIKGTLAEWLGNGLQNRVRRFESARYLDLRDVLVRLFFCFKAPIRETILK